MRSLGRCFFVVIAIVVLFPLAPVFAAEIKILGSNGFGQTLVSLKGEIKPGDATTYLARTAGIDNALVLLDSPGGAISDAIAIAEINRARTFQVSVAPKATCASACGLIWLSSDKRFLAAKARVGFHAAYQKSDHAVAGTANALIGAYFARLGVSNEIISYITTAMPRDMSWLTTAKAAELGIEIASSDPAFFVVSSQETVPFTEYFAQVADDVIACDEAVMRTILKYASDKRRLNEFIQANARKCIMLSKRDILNVERIDQSDPLVCVRRPAEAECRWTVLRMTIAMPRAPVKPPATVAKSVQDFAAETSCRRMLAKDSRERSSNDPARSALAPVNGITLDWCRAHFACANVAAAKSRLADPYACRVEAAWASTDALCSATIDRRTGTWRTEAELGYALSELQLRRVSLSQCRDAVQRGTAAATAVLATPHATPAQSDERATLAALPSLDLCRQSIAPATGRWNQDGPAVVQALKRGLTIEACHSLIACSDTEAAAKARSANPLACRSDLTGVPQETLCIAALDRRLLTWRNDWTAGFILDELQRRRVSYGTCLREAEASEARQRSDPFREASAERVEADADLCRMAMDVVRGGWSAQPEAAHFVEAAGQRGLSPRDCAAALAALADLSRWRMHAQDRRSLCRQALDDTGKDWVGDPDRREYVLEAARRSLTVQDCRTAASDP
jgi:hypothetical protein